MQAQLDKLRSAYASGLTTATYDGKTVTYRGLDEMRAAIAALENQIAGGRGVGKSIVVRSTKAW
jgi:hypothetical protein